MQLQYHKERVVSDIWATKYFRPYLFGRKFNIFTDHKPLQWVKNLKEPNSRLTRWKLKLSEYDFSVIYKKGKNKTNADALSRVQIHNEEISSIVVNPSEKPSSIANNSSTETVHTSLGNPILLIPIADEPLNKFHRQIIMTIVGDLKRIPNVTKPFETYTRTFVQISENNLIEDIVKIIKEYVNPKHCLVDNSYYSRSL